MSLADHIHRACHTCHPRLTTAQPQPHGTSSTAPRAATHAAALALTEDPSDLGSEDYFAGAGGQSPRSDDAHADGARARWTAPPAGRGRGVRHMEKRSLLDGSTRSDALNAPTEDRDARGGAVEMAAR